jgi:hypothetical protein
VTSFHHQPEAQHPKSFSYPQERRPITPSLGLKEMSRHLRALSALPPIADINLERTSQPETPRCQTGPILGRALLH